LLACEGVKTGETWMVVEQGGHKTLVVCDAFFNVEEECTGFEGFMLRRLRTVGALQVGRTFAWLAVRNRRIVEHMTPTRIALWQNLFAAICLLVVVAGFGVPVPPSQSDVALLLVLGVACTGLAHTLFISSLHRVSAHAASIVAALEPVYGIALAAWLLGESPGPRTLAGAALIVAAAIIATRREPASAV
jgi:drug/metabolite transporter (DMT)-like permease